MPFSFSILQHMLKDWLSFYHCKAVLPLLEFYKNGMIYSGPPCLSLAFSLMNIRLTTCCCISLHFLEGSAYFLILQSRKLKLEEWGNFSEGFSSHVAHAGLPHKIFGLGNYFSWCCSLVLNWKDETNTHSILLVSKHLKKASQAQEKNTFW